MAIVVRPDCEKGSIEYEGESQSLFVRCCDKQRGTLTSVHRQDGQCYIDYQTGKGCKEGVCLHSEAGQRESGEGRPSLE